MVYLHTVASVLFGVLLCGNTVHGESSCPAGQFHDTGGCVVCPAGHYCPVGTVLPLACPSGTYNAVTGSPTVTDCMACAAGSYSNTPGTTTCKTCPAGTFCPGPGSAVPVTCKRGHYCPVATDVPITCPVGTFSSMTGSVAVSDCIACPAGTYSVTVGASSCTTCPAGKFCPAPDSPPTECSPGTYSSLGATACTTCPAGMYCPATNHPPTECSPGTYSSVGATTCTSCPSDHYCPTASTAPIACPTGYYAHQGSSSCHFNVTGTVYCQCHEGWTKHQGSCYRSYTTEYNFRDAEAKCKEVDAHVVRVETSQENMFLESFLSGLNGTLHWIGLSRGVNGTWQWRGTDTAVSVASWEPGRPAQGSRANCAVVWSDANGTSWLDEPCALHLPPICEKSCGVIPVVG